MPNRIIKESAFQSDKIASLSDFEFRLWVGLITAVDDAGRGDARPAIIKGRIFPLRERVTNKDIEAAIHSLADKGCISLYKVGGKSYFCFPTWSKHQRVRDCKPKYPGMEEKDDLQQSAANCGELPPNPIQSESNQNPNPNPNPMRAGSDADGAFERFWSAYPRKVSKQEAKKAFVKALEKTDIDTMLAAIEAQKNCPQWVKDKGQFIPHPSTWLNQCRWNDETEVQGNGTHTGSSFQKMRIGTVL